MTRTSWTERKTNLGVLKELGEERKLLNEIEKRKIRITEHIIRHNTFIKNIYEGKVLGKEGRGRPRRRYFEDIRDRMGSDSYAKMKRTAEDRGEWLLRQGTAFRT